MGVKLSKHDMAWVNDQPRRVFQYDVRGYPTGEGASIAQEPHHGWSVMRWTDKVQTEWMDDFSTADEALAVLQTRFDQGDSPLITNQKVEGSLDIVWMNFEKRDDIPVFALHFMPYKGFKDGAQRRKELLGEQALKRYLQQLGFSLLRIYEILGVVRTSYSIDLPNVMMNGYEYAVTYRN
jgi:hypothetical protein